MQLNTDKLVKNDTFTIGERQIGRRKTLNRMQIRFVNKYLGFVYPFYYTLMILPFFTIRNRSIYPNSCL